MNSWAACPLIWNVSLNIRARVEVVPWSMVNMCFMGFPLFCIVFYGVFFIFMGLSRGVMGGGFWGMRGDSLTF